SQDAQRRWLSEEAMKEERKMAVSADELSPWRADKGKIRIPPSSKEILLDRSTIIRMLTELEN
ncbi:MAG TPA: hypothetical protein VFJ52_07650, partial [Terriglobia bacterium]|nr:hypothetical protein [Terriglobia bacterium]